MDEARGDKPFRVAYLCCHVAGRDVELPVLRSLGYEVFTMKKVLGDHRSVATDYADDAYLTLPSEVVRQLNDEAFLDAVRWKPDTKHNLNRYFDALFCIQNAHVVREALLSFRGTVVIRLAGLDAPKTYTNYYNYFSSGLMPLLYENKHRIWFSLQYPRLADVEDPIFRERGLYMPLGMPSFAKHRADSWEPDSQRFIATVIPWVHTTYYKPKYERAVRLCRGYRLRILGDQKSKSQDSRILGYLDQEAYAAQIKRASLFLYDSMEPRHVHYPPLEAAMMGVPVLFFAPSLLNDLGEPPLFGACRSSLELREKMSLIMSGDASFVRDVVASQKSLLATFSDQHVWSHWQSAFHSIVRSASGNERAVNKLYDTPVGPPRISTAKVSTTLSKTVDIGCVREGIWQTGVFRFWRQYEYLWVVVKYLCDPSEGPSSILTLQLEGDASAIQGFRTVRDVYLRHTKAEVSDIFCVPLSALTLAEQSGALRFHSCDSTQIDAELLVCGGTTHDNQIYRIGERDRDSAPFVWRGFSTRNSQGLDLDEVEGELWFFVSDELVDVTAQISLTVDAYPSREPYSIALSLNNHCIAVHENTHFKGTLQFTVRDGLRAANVLRVKVTGRPDLTDGQFLSAHISSLLLRV